MQLNASLRKLQWYMVKYDQGLQSTWLHVRCHINKTYSQTYSFLSSYLWLLMVKRTWYRINPKARQYYMCYSAHGPCCSQKLQHKERNSKPFPLNHSRISGKSPTLPESDDCCRNRLTSGCIYHLDEYSVQLTSFHHMDWQSFIIQSVFDNMWNNWMWAYYQEQAVFWSIW